jgi:hypothetical protein
MENVINKHQKDGNELKFRYAIGDNCKISVYLIELNGEEVRSGRCFRSTYMTKVVSYLESLVVDESWLTKYKVHTYIKPNPPKKKVRKTYVLIKANVIKLMRFNPLTQTFREVARGYFQSELESMKFGDMEYRYEFGGHREFKIEKSEYERALEMGLDVVDTTQPLVMRKANGKSRKVHRANQG